MSQKSFGPQKLFKAKIFFVFQKSFGPQKLFRAMVVAQIFWATKTFQGEDFFRVPKKDCCVQDCCVQFFGPQKLFKVKIFLVFQKIFWATKTFGPQTLFQGDGFVAQIFWGNIFCLAMTKKSFNKMLSKDASLATKPTFFFTRFRKEKQNKEKSFFFFMKLISITNNSIPHPQSSLCQYSRNQHQKQETKRPLQVLLGFPVAPSESA